LDIGVGRPKLTLIHAKGVHTRNKSGAVSDQRSISVASYEVVVGQAVKNIRWLDRVAMIDHADADPRKIDEKLAATVKHAWKVHEGLGTLRAHGHQHHARQPRLHPAYRGEHSPTFNAWIFAGNSGKVYTPSNRNSTNGNPAGLQEFPDMKWRKEMAKNTAVTLAALLLAVVSAEAQTATGVIQGTVKDETGAVIVGVRVKLTDQATNQTREQSTNAEGIFEFRALPRGDYTIEAEHAGFKRQVITNTPLQVAQTQNLQVTLQVGGVAESVEVQAAAGLLQDSEASLSQVIDEKRVLELPINGRNLMQLIPLSAGVITAGRASATQRQGNYGSGFSVGGQRDNTSVVLVDGMEISGQEINNYPLAIPSLDSVAEFRVQTSNYSAEFGGNSGAVVNVASKRGSNELHATSAMKLLVALAATLIAPR
jgi:hypothetical protein